MKYIDLIEEAEMLVHYLSSPSVNEREIFSRFPTLIWYLYNYKDHETIQKLYNAYKNFMKKELFLGLKIN